MTTIIVEIKGEEVTLKTDVGSYTLKREDLVKLDQLVPRISDALAVKPVEVLRALSSIFDLSFVDHFKVAIPILTDTTLKPHEKLDALSSLKHSFKAWLISKLMEMPTVAKKLESLEKSNQPITDFVLDKAKPEEVARAIAECVEKLGLKFAKTLGGTLFLINHGHLYTYDVLPHDLVNVFDVDKRGVVQSLEEALLRRAKTIIVGEDCNPPMMLPFNNAILDLTTWRSYPLSDNPPYFTYWVDCHLSFGLLEKFPELDVGFWESQCPKFLSLIKRLFPGENFDKCLEMLGSILIPSPLRRAFFVVGPPGVGKSTFASVLIKTLKGLCSCASLEDIAESRFNWDLMGKLVNISTEGSHIFISERGLARLNRLTGDDTLKFERKYHDRVDGPNYLKLIFLLNEFPLFKRIDDALLERLYIIETTEEAIQEPRPMVDVVKDILTEREQIIHFMLWCTYQLTKDGYVKFRHDMTVEQKKELLLESMNPVNRWIEEECEMDPNASENRKLLYSSYEMWAQRTGAIKLPQSAFYATLRSLGFREARRHGEYYFKGLRLRDRGERSLV